MDITAIGIYYVLIQASQFFVWKRGLGDKIMAFLLIRISKMGHKKKKPYLISSVNRLRPGFLGIGLLFTPDRFYESNTENAPECECLHKELYRIVGAAYRIHAKLCKQNPIPTWKGIRYISDPVLCKWGLKMRIVSL